MFNFFKKKSEPAILPAEIPVRNLKQYIVDGYNKEKILEDELEEVRKMYSDDLHKMDKLQSELDAVRVIADTKTDLSEGLERKAKDLEWELEVIRKNKATSEERLTEQINTLKIQLKQHELKETTYSKSEVDSMIRGVKLGCKDILVNRINGHKGNLSKATVLNYIETSFLESEGVANE